MDKVRIALKRARNTLEECKSALPLLEQREESARRLAAKGVITFGRSVTLALQTMGNAEPRFKEWYAPYVEELSADPLFSFFKNKRNGIVHETEDIDMTHLRFATFYDPAPGAIDDIVRDGSMIKGVEIDLVKNRRYALVVTPEGKEDERDIQMRTDKPWWESIEVRSFFSDAPAEYASQTMVENCKRYIDYLERMVSEAELVFG